MVLDVGVAHEIRVALESGVAIEVEVEVVGDNDLSDVPNVLADPL